MKSMHSNIIATTTNVMCIYRIPQPYGQSRMQEYFAAKKAFAKEKGLDLKHTHTLDDRK